MTRRTVQVLAALIVGLVLLLLVVNRDGNDIPAGRTLFLPGFKAVANDARQISISRSGENDVIVARRDDGRWTVSSRDGYPADVGKLGQLITALADARVVEEKTSNPANYQRLGVDDPGDGGSGTLVTITGPDFSYSAILGNTAQGNYRYARVPDQGMSYLIDQNPSSPESAGDWLQPEILDIAASRVQRMSVTHSDGETVVIEKNDETQADYDVIGVPEGRELEYAAVGNAMAGALAGLELDDVRKRVDTAAATSVTVVTHDGMTVTAEVVGGDDSTWVAFAAQGEDSGIVDEAEAINERLSGWQYRVPEYRKNLLTRRWDDLLKDVDE